MQITTITTWLTENYGIILLALVISLILFNKQIKSFFKSKKEKKIGYKAEVSEYGMDLSESLFNLENSLFSELQPRDPLSSMKGQREEAEKKLDASGNEISHVGFTIKWAQQNGKVVYTKQA